MSDSEQININQTLAIGASTEQLSASGDLGMSIADGGWPLSFWMSQLAEVAAAKDVAEYWQRLSVLLGAMAPYHTAVSWNDWSATVFSGIPCDTQASSKHALIAHDVWRNYQLATVTLRLSGDESSRVAYVLSQAQLSSSEAFYRRYLRPFSWEHALVVPFWREDSVRAGIVLFRTGAQGEFGSDVLARVRGVSSILQALALSVIEHERRHTVQSSALDVLGDLPVGLLLLNWELKPIFANEEGYRQTHGWNYAPAPPPHGDARIAFHLPDDLRQVCDDLRRRWARDVFGFRPAAEGNLVEQVQHPRHLGLKATISIPPRYPGTAVLPSILIRYAGMATRADPAFQPTRAQLAVLAQLTPGERNVTLLVMRGMSNREIADALHREISTVKDHLSHIYSKLGIRRRTQLAALFTE